MIGLTPRQQSLINYIERYLQMHEYAPSIAEIADGLQLASPTILQHLRALEKKGMIKRSKLARSLHLVHEVKKSSVTGLFGIDLLPDTVDFSTFINPPPKSDVYYMNPRDVVNNFKETFVALRLTSVQRGFLPNDILLIQRQKMAHVHGVALVRQGDFIALKDVSPQTEILGEVRALDRQF